MNYEDLKDLANDNIEKIIIDLYKDIAIIEYKIDKLYKDKIIKQNTIMKLKGIIKENAERL